MQISVKVPPVVADATMVTAVITGHNHGGYAAVHSKLRFVGASCSASVLPGTGTDTCLGISSFTIQVEKGKPGVIALVGDFNEAVGQRVTDRTERCLIPILWNGDTLEIKPHLPFVSRPDCLGQIVGNDLTITCPNGKRFSTCHRTMFGEVSNRQKFQQIQADGYAIVLDGNLLCRFLVGEATLGEVEKAVIAKPVDVQALIGQNALLGLEVATLKAEKEFAIKRANQLNEMYQRAQGSLEALQSEHRKLQEAHDRVCSEYRQDQVVLASLDKELCALKRARVKDLQTIIGLIANEGTYRAKDRFGGLWWVALSRVKTFVTTALRGLESEASDQPDHNMG